MTTRTEKARIFSPWVEQTLVQAAQTRITQADPEARMRAIDEATQYAKNQHPELFKKA